MEVVTRRRLSVFPSYRERSAHDWSGGNERPRAPYDFGNCRLPTVMEKEGERRLRCVFSTGYDRIEFVQQVGRLDKQATNPPTREMLHDLAVAKRP